MKKKITKILITTYTHYGIDKSTEDVNSLCEAFDWVKKNFPNAEKIENLVFNDEDSDTRIEIL